MKINIIADKIYVKPIDFLRFINDSSPPSILHSRKGRGIGNGTGIHIYFFDRLAD